MESSVSASKVHSNINHHQQHHLGHRWTHSPVDLSVSSMNSHLNFPNTSGMSMINHMNKPSALEASLLGASPSVLQANGYSLSGHPSMIRSNSMSSSSGSSPASLSGVFNSRKQRTFIPDSLKDEGYFDRRKRNNEAAKRSREKRRISDMVIEQRVLDLTKENVLLKTELYAIKEKFGLPLNQLFVNPDSISLPIPENNCRGRRNKLLSAVIPGNPFNVLNAPNSTSDQGTPVVNNYISASSPLSSSSSLSETNSPSSGDHGHNNMNGTSNGDKKNGSVSGSPSSGTSLPHKLRHKARHIPCENENPTSVLVSDAVVAQHHQQQLAFHHLRAITASVLEAAAVSKGHSLHHFRDDDVILVENDISRHTEDMIKREQEDEQHEEDEDDGVPRKMARNSQEGTLSIEVTDLSLERENYTLRNELHRLASEVASLKTFLVPKNSSSPSSSPNNETALNPYGESRIRANSFLSYNTCASSEHNEEEEEEKEEEVDVEEDTLMPEEDVQDKELCKEADDQKEKDHLVRPSEKKEEDGDRAPRSSCESNNDEEQEKHSSKRK